jgi:hypothetical protein
MKNRAAIQKILYLPPSFAPFSSAARLRRLHRLDCRLLDRHHGPGLEVRNVLSTNKWHRKFQNGNFAPGQGWAFSTVSQPTSVLGSKICVRKSETYRCLMSSEHLKRPTDARTRSDLNSERCASRSQEIHGPTRIAGYRGISSSRESLPGERDGTTMRSRPGRGCPSSP